MDTFIGEPGREISINCIVIEKGTQYSMMYIQHVISVRYNKVHPNASGQRRKQRHEECTLCTSVARKVYSKKYFASHIRVRGIEPRGLEPLHLSISTVRLLLLVIYPSARPNTYTTLQSPGWRVKFIQKTLSQDAKFGYGESNPTGGE